MSDVNPISVLHFSSTDSSLGHLINSFSHYEHLDLEVKSVVAPNNPQNHSNGELVILVEVSKDGSVVEGLSKMVKQAHSDNHPKYVVICGLNKEQVSGYFDSLDADYSFLINNGCKAFYDNVRQISSTVKHKYQN